MRTEGAEVRGLESGIQYSSWGGSWVDKVKG